MSNINKENAQVIKEKIEKLNEQKRKIEFEIEDIIQTSMPKFNSIWNTVGSWDCKNSPIGVCVYNHMEDPALDDCLYCGKPDERK